MIAEAEEGIQAAFTQTQEHPLKMEAATGWRSGELRRQILCDIIIAVNLT